MKTIKFLIIALFCFYTSTALAVVTTVQNSQSFSCSGSTSVFSFTFPVYTPYTLAVAVNTGAVSTPLTAISQYTVTTQTYLNGGTVTLTNPLICPSGSVLVVTRQTPQTQTTLYKNGYYLNQSVLMSDLDKLWMAMQDLTLTPTCNSACQAAITAFLTNITVAPSEIFVGADATIPDYPGAGTKTIFLPASGIETICKIDSTANTITVSPSVGGQAVALGPLSVQGECWRFSLIGTLWYAK